MLAYKLKYLMLEAGVSPRELSLATNIDKSTLIKILSGVTTNPRVETIHTLAKYFKVGISELIDESYTTEFAIKPSSSDLQNILKSLMQVNGVASLSLLHKYTGISLSILSDILTGKTKHPHMKTLQQLASFFNVTVTQLSGMEAIPKNKTASITTEKISIPVFDINHVEKWISGKLTEASAYSSTSRKIIGSKSYAIIITDNKLMPDFMNNQVLIIDNEGSITKNSFLVCKIENKTSIYECIDLVEDLITLRAAGQFECINTAPDQVNLLGVVVQQISNK